MKYNESNSYLNNLQSFKKFTSDYSMHQFGQPMHWNGAIDFAGISIDNFLEGFG